MENAKIEIPLSKVKMIFLILGSMLFITLCIFILMNAENMQTRKINNPLVIRIIALIGLLFFGVILMSILKKMFNKEPGLIIDKEGIWDNSSGVSVGRIKRKDIIGLRKVKVSGTKFMLIEVQNPDEYINNIKGLIKKQAMKANMKKYGTPISISSAGLKINFKKLEEVLLSEFQKNR